MTTFNKWDELDPRGLPRASYINARVALHRLDAQCGWSKSDDGPGLRWEWALFDVGDSDRPMWCNVRATDLRDAIIDVFGFDPGAKPLKQAMAAMEAEACRRPAMRLNYSEWVPGESQAAEELGCAV